MRSDLIVFGEDWGWQPTGTHHLVRHLGTERKVVWVNSWFDPGRDQSEPLDSEPRLDRFDLRFDQPPQMIAVASGPGELPFCPGPDFE